MRFPTMFVLLQLLVGVTVAQTPTVVDSNNRIIGYYIAPAPPAALGIATLTGFTVAMKSATAEVVSGRYGPTGTSIETFQLDYFYYTEPGCIGQAYVRLSGEAEIGGFLFRSPATPGLFFAPKTLPVANRAFLSARLPGGACNPDNSTTGLSIEVFPNDPGVTGFDPTTIAAPLKVGIVDEPRILLRNGFEGVFHDMKPPLGYGFG